MAAPAGLPYSDVLCTLVNEKNHSKLRAALAKHSPNAPTNSERWPLGCAANQNDWEAAEILLEAGADPNWVSTSTDTHLLDKCVDNNRLDFAKKLLAYKGPIPVNVNVGNKYNQTAASSALLNCKFDFVDLFLAHGLDPNHRDEWGNTLSHNAGTVAALEYLSKKPIFNVNALDNDGSTPLHHAAKNYSKDVGAKLVALGADKTIKNKEGKTPIQMLLPAYQEKEEWQAVFA